MLNTKRFGAMKLFPTKLGKCHPLKTRNFFGNQWVLCIHLEMVSCSCLSKECNRVIGKSNRTRYKVRYRPWSYSASHITQTNLRRLVSLQKQFFRIISKSAFYSHLDPTFKELYLELLKLSDIRQLKLGKLMFSFNHSLLPSKLNT